VGALLNRYGCEVRDLGGYEMHAVHKPQLLQQQKQGRLTTKGPITVALIGCGAVSTVLHAPALDSLASEGLLETVALVDPDPDRTSKIGKTLSGARQYRDINAMLADITPDMAIIATPHWLHAPLTVSCVESGIHVLCEKPLAVTTTDCDRMIEAAERAGCVLAVGHFRRFFPSCQMIRDILRAGLLGAVQSFRFLEGERYDWPAQSAFYFKREQAGGGVLLDAGAHTIDLLLWWLGDAAEVEYQDDAMGEVEANCKLHMRMASGAEGMVRLSQDWPLPNRYVIQCEKGWIAYLYDVVDRVQWGLRNSDWGLNAEIRTMAAGSRAGLPELGSSVPRFLDYYALQLRNVIAAIRGTEPLKVSVKDARKAVALIEKCYRTRKLLEMPWLDDAEIRRARELAHG
jgi:predicted dehydrogenase